MFQRVLVANRGEIAVRICRTLRSKGIESVAIYAADDLGSMHVEVADEAIALGEGSVAETYLDTDKILAAIERTGAHAVHPGYGFLSENASFAQALEHKGIAFIGPRAEHLKSFGLKHEARRIAESAGVTLLPGSSVLSGIEEAKREAAAIGYPIMLKSSAGGGGIGMQRCDDEEELVSAYEAVARLAANAFSDSRLFVERYIVAPRHVEVQAFGDGKGGVAILGDRDCSLQRRHQKVVEECPAPNLPNTVRERMHEDARSLLSSVSYRSAGTVEFVYDPVRQVASFLEVNTRLQVEHGVTELVYGIDIVSWMLDLAAGELPELQQLTANLKPQGHAMQARVCAEDPNHDFRPTPGLLSVVEFPTDENVRIDTWLRSGSLVSSRFDSLVAKVLTHDSTREFAREKLRSALSRSTLHGIETNLEYLNQALAEPAFNAATHDTTTLANLDYQPQSIEIVSPGPKTTIQQWPGREGYWAVGVPPSGPMDDLSFRLGNKLIGNPEGAAGIEITVSGPTFACHGAMTVLVAGSSEIELTRYGCTTKPQAWSQIALERGDRLRIGQVTEGQRAYVLFAGGLEIPQVMGSAATFSLGGLGGLDGRELKTGSVLRVAPQKPSRYPIAKAKGTKPHMDARHVLRITMGPHCTEDFLTAEDVDEFLDAEWEVHYHSDRTGVRLIGPRPTWTRSDGGDAGLHPSNVHDNAYAFGVIDFTGDMPVVLGPDGPSLGGFVCPGAVIEADRWKLGQLIAGDKVTFEAVSEEEAHTASRIQEARISSVDLEVFSVPRRQRNPIQNPIIDQIDDICVRRAAQDTMLIEFGPNVLDFELRLRVDRLETQIREEQVAGVLETTAGIRSLLLRFDSKQVDSVELTRTLEPLFKLAREPEQKRVSRVVHLPLSWDDPACRQAIERYTQSVRADAPWCPDNIEFIRRINGLSDQDGVKEIVFDAEYLVFGLGDVYLGAPVAVPVDPRHRLVTTKYNPARIWTAENSVGIGGAYLCIYGMEGPGGYQFVGRTIQVWNQFQRGSVFSKPWLLRPFDRIKFYEVSAKELQEMRRAFPHGALDVTIEEDEFDLKEYQGFLNDHATGIAEFEERRKAAFEEELADWRERGLLTLEQDCAENSSAVNPEENDRALVASPLAGSIWSIEVKSGQRVEAGEVLFVVESMKTEFEVTAPYAGEVGEILVAKGQTVSSGQALATAA